MALYPTHCVAVIGGAVAGSEAAINLAYRGIKVVVFEQNIRPYGKIEDGLPKWHVKLQAKEERKIDEKLSHANILFVPNTALGREINLPDLVKNWGFSAILLANGAWRDRPLPLEGADEYVDSGLIYQNDLVRWFNHYHEPGYNGVKYQIPDSAIIIGGGLASLDVVKVAMLETVLPALKKLNIGTNILELEHKTIAKVLEEHNLSLEKIGIKGCTLFYRRRIKDMPLAQIPAGASPGKIEKILASREKILRNFQYKYLFRVRECRVPSGLIIEDGMLAGLKFKETEISNGEVQVKDETEYEVRSPLVISSIGSIPEPVEGIEMKGELYDMNDPATGKLNNYDNVFAIGNVVTGKGNINVSTEHGRQVASHVLENFLAWKEEDYEKLLQFSEQRSKDRVDNILKILEEKNLLDVDRIDAIVKKVERLQRNAGYNGKYSDWISKHKLKSIEQVIAEKKSSGN